MGGVHFFGRMPQQVFPGQIQLIQQFPLGRVTHVALNPRQRHQALTLGYLRDPMNAGRGIDHRMPRRELDLPRAEGGAEVTEGERLVALAWIQSYVRDPAKRELLFELDQAREHLLRHAPEERSTSYVDRCYANLVRMWAEL